MSYFDEYKRLSDPEKCEKAKNWEMAIGLQAVDGLKPSEYLLEFARKNTAIPQNLLSKVAI